MLQKDINSKWFNIFYYSYFNIELGIFRGVYIGNIIDFEIVIGREEFFFIEFDFSYGLEELC